MSGVAVSHEKLHLSHSSVLEVLYLHCIFSLVVPVHLGSPLCITIKLLLDSAKFDEYLDDFPTKIFQVYSL